MYKMIIIDDQDVVREGLKVRVCWKDYDIDIIGEAASAEKGLKLIERTYPDIVITDVRMGLMSGLDMIERVRSFQEDTQFIVISGYEEFAYARKALQLEVVHYLLKPIDDDELREAVIKAVERLDMNRSNKSIGESQEITEEGPPIDKVLDYVYAHYREPLTLKLIAHRFFYNCNYLGQAIRKETGLSFNDMIHDLRIQEACAILRQHPGVRLNLISEQLGYKDVCYFSKIFKRITGNNPSRYISREEAEREVP